MAARLLVVKVGVPDVEDQQDACCVASVPSLVLERIVEDEGNALDAVVRTARDADRGARAAHDRQLDAQLLVGRAVVLDDVRLRDAAGSGGLKRVT